MPPEPTSFIRPDVFWRTVGLQTGETVVHLGCGAGFYLLPAAKLVGKTGKVIGIDVRADMLEEAESRARREEVDDTVHTIRADLEKPKGSTLPADNADWVLVANILHQADPTAILTEAKRIVKPTGAIVVVEWDTIASPMGPPPDQRISQETVQQTIAAVGLTIADTWQPSKYHYGLTLKRPS